MTVTPGHFDLSPEQRRFMEMVSDYPDLAKFWNWDDRSLDLPAAEKALGYLSGGEAYLLRFFVMVWLSGNELDFDLAQAVQVLDTPELKVIRVWLEDPFRP